MTSDTKTKFKDQILEYNKSTKSDAVYTADSCTSAINSTAIGDVPNSEIYVGDNPLVWGDSGFGIPAGWGGAGGGDIILAPHTGISDGNVLINTKDTNGWGKLTINSDNIGTVAQIMPAQQKNKLDKDLIDSKLPYNLKKDYDGNLIYEIAVAGYTDVLIQKIKDGLRVLLDEEEKDDLVGEEFDFICQGIKMKKQEINIFIDQDDFDTKNHSAELENGILTLMIPIKKVNTEEFTAIKSKNKKIKVS
jgi:HSP20 family molecular chaperone IbpA